MKIFLPAISILLALFLATPAIAQQAAPQQAQPDITVTDSDLNSFADAQMSIMQIQQDYSQRLQNADNPDAANQLQQEANEKMVGAVEEAGLDVESFNAIAMAIQNDPELQERLQELL